MKRNKTITILVSASQTGEILNNPESITGDFSDAKKVKWLNDLSKSDCFSDPRSLVLWQHYLIAFKTTHVAFFNYDLTLLEGTIPTIWSLSALPKVQKAPSTGRTARDKQPQGCACCWRDQGEGQSFVLHSNHPQGGYSTAVTALPTGQDGTQKFTPAEGKCSHRVLSLLLLLSL